MITLTPRYYQKEAVKEIFNYFDHEQGNPLIVLPTGSGKSLVQALIADKIIHEYAGCRILFLTHQQELIQQIQRIRCSSTCRLFTGTGNHDFGECSRT